MILIRRRLDVPFGGGTLYDRPFETRNRSLNQKVPESENPPLTFRTDHSETLYIIHLPRQQSPLPSRYTTPPSPIRMRNSHAEFVH